MPTKEQMLNWHDQVFSFFYDYNKNHPEFTFAPRVRDDKRLNDGYWFQGAEDYVFAGMSKKNDGANKTRQVGFVIWTEKETGNVRFSSEIVFKSTNNAKLAHYLEEFSIKNNYDNEKEGSYYRDKKYKYIFPKGTTLQQALPIYLNEHWLPLLKFATKQGVKDDLYFPQKKFTKAISRILEIQEKELTTNTLVLHIAPNFKEERGKKRHFKGVDINYEAEQKNATKLGKEGEDFVLKMEREKFKDRPELLTRIKKMKDGEGFDILSFDKHGKEICIEVKTTDNQKHTPFHITENEVAFSESNAAQYQLWRLYNWDVELQHADYYILKGNMRQVLHLLPQKYTVFPNS